MALPLLSSLSTAGLCLVDSVWPDDHLAPDPEPPLVDVLSHQDGRFDVGKSGVIWVQNLQLWRAEPSLEKYYSSSTSTNVFL